jgi:hypothetical protein
VSHFETPYLGFAIKGPDRYEVTATHLAAAPIAAHDPSIGALYRTLRS